MTERFLTASPRRIARIAGALYVFTIVAGIFGQLVAAPAQAGLAETAQIAGTLAYVGVTLLLYVLLKPVNGTIAFIATVFSLVGCTAGILEAVHHPLPVQSIIFFGPYCLLIGYLIYQSGFMPRTIGVLLMLAGLGWLTFAAPALIHKLPPFQILTGLIGEGALTFWLLVFGVDERRWNQRAVA